jgi:signal transduction histidine kinase
MVPLCRSAVFALGLGELRMYADAVQTLFAGRVILWAALGTVVAFPTHELRERKEALLLHDQLTALTLVQDRDRIATDLQGKVIQQVFAVGMNLHSTAMLGLQPHRPASTRRHATYLVRFP